MQLHHTSKRNVTTDNTLQDTKRFCISASNKPWRHRGEVEVQLYSVLDGGGW